LAAPRSLSISESELTLENHNGSVRELRSPEIQKAKFVNKWGDKWQFRVADQNVLVRGEGFPQSAWDRMRDLIGERLTANNIPFGLYDLNGNCVYEFKGAGNESEIPAST
jgi:hypothetical protein